MEHKIRRAERDDEASLNTIRERSGWQLQPVRDEQRALLAAWIAAEPDHAGRTTAEDWLAERRGVQNMLAVDRQGPLLFLRCSNVMRFDLQIAPESELRAARALVSGLPWFIENLKNQGYRELIGETCGRNLIRLLHRIGFRESKNEHVLAL